MQSLLDSKANQQADDPNNLLKQRVRYNRTPPKLHKHARIRHAYELKTILDKSCIHSLREEKEPTIWNR